MASLSTGSVSGSSSLGNTSLRGFGGMASGIDRDAIIEQMTLGTNTKITNQESAITKLEWKQEAFRGISDKIIDLADNYSSYSATMNLKDPSVFAKNVISIHAKDSISKFVTATGTSALVSNVSIQSVRQLATSSVRQSEKREGGELKTTLNDLNKEGMRASNLIGTQLRFGRWVSDKDGERFEDGKVFTFGSSYTKEVDGKKETVDLTSLYLGDDYEALADGLNEAMKAADITFGSGNDAKKLGEDIRLQYDSTGKQMQFVDKNGNTLTGSDFEGFSLQSNSTALKGLGFATDSGSVKQVSFDDFNNAANKTSFEDASVTKQSAIQYLTGKKVMFNYDGTQKEIELITSEEKAALEGLVADKDNITEEEKQNQINALAANIQKRLDQAFGTAKVDNGVVTGGVKVNVGAEGLTFSTKADSSVSITSGDSVVLENLGIASGESNKVNTSGKLGQSALGIDIKDEKYEDGLVINGVKIGGIDENTSISTILSKINNSKAGVNATYVSATGQFMLVSRETGAGREIELDSQLAKDLFGGDEAKGARFEDGKNAQIEVSYGNGVNVMMERSSNTFNLEGLNVTVSGVFGGEYAVDADGNKTDQWISDSSETVSFSARADVDKVTEQVKKFFEDFNAIVTEVNTQVTTRPDSSYGPLTDEQKNEMSETSIENWEKKAKAGLLFNDSTMRELSMDIQSIFSKLMSNGASYDDLKKIGITYSEDYKDGGKLVFDESAFRSAMESDPELVSDIFTGGGDVSKGLMKTVEDTFTPYATRFASRNQVGNSKGSYGRLIEEAGSEKVPTSLLNNQIYKEIKSKQELIEQLRAKLVTEQDRYISMFTTMETMINQMNSQSSWLSQLG